MNAERACVAPLRRLLERRDGRGRVHVRRVRHSVLQVGAAQGGQGGVGAPISANRLFVFNVGRQPQPQSFGSCLGVRSNDDEGEGPVVRSTVHSFKFRLRAGVSGRLRCIPPAFPAPALLRATFYEFKRTPVTMINTMTPVRWRCPSCIYTGYLRCADEGSGRIERI